MLGHNANIIKFKKTEIIPSIFSNHNTMILEINYKKKAAKKHKHMEAKQYASKQAIDNWRNLRENKKRTLETNENEYMMIWNL